MGTKIDFYSGVTGVLYTGNRDGQGIWNIITEDRTVRVYESNCDAESARALAFEIREYYEECFDDGCMPLFWSWVRNLKL